MHPAVPRESLLSVSYTHLDVYKRQIPTRLFKQAVNLSKQARAIEASLDGITPFNAGKKKEEALSLLKKWFPQMENFSGQLKKYKVTINDLLAENEQLEARAKDQMQMGRFLVHVNYR